MSYTYIKDSTTAYAGDILNNFEWIAQENVLPMGASTLSYTTGVHDLGSSTYKWKDMYCNNIDVETAISGGIYTLIGRTELDETASEIAFEGLNGDTNSNYLLIAMINRSSGARLDLNFEDSGGTDLTGWGYQGFKWQSPTSDVESATSNNEAQINDSTGVEAILEVYLNINTTYAKTALSHYGSRGDGAAAPPNQMFRGHILNNTGTTVTAIKLDNITFDAGTVVYLWGIR